MSGSYLAGPPREADKGGKRGMEGDFPICALALFIRSDRKERGNLSVRSSLRDCFVAAAPRNDLETQSLLKRGGQAAGPATLGVTRRGRRTLCYVPETIVTTALPSFPSFVAGSTIILS